MLLSNSLDAVPPLPVLFEPTSLRSQSPLLLLMLLPLPPPPPPRVATAAAVSALSILVGLALDNPVLLARCCVSPCSRVEYERPSEQWLRLDPCATVSAFNTAVDFSASKRSDWSMTVRSSTLA